VQTNEVGVDQAIEHSPAHCRELAALAEQHRRRHLERGQCETIRAWQPDAGTWCYQTHIAIPGQSPERLAWLAEVFYNAAALASYPWYPQFAGGRCQALEQVAPGGIARHQLCWGRFDLGLSALRYYRQLVSLAQPDDRTAVIAARSVHQGPALPGDALLTFTVAPNGEVLHFADGCLHWHHICCTTGAGLLPGRLDRWLINGLRWLRLDQAERKTYRQEAEMLNEWLQSATPVVDYAADVPLAPASASQ